MLSNNSFFFVGIAGTGMSAIAQYLKGIGKNVSGSDRLFSKYKKLDTQVKFEAMGIDCYFQDGSGITPETDIVVVSTAIEESNVEYQKALSLGIRIVKRSALLAAISESKKTIAVGGTSGKSTTTAMIFHILECAGKSPSLITGAGLSSLQEKGLLGNAWNGDGEYLVIEADESDGSIVSYKPYISVLLNVERDHKEEDELMQLFSTFKANTSYAFIVNAGNKLAKQLSNGAEWQFEAEGVAGKSGYEAFGFSQKGFEISFELNGMRCNVPLIGKHNMENTLAAVAVCKEAGVEVADAIEAMKTFKGIYRRTQLLGRNKERNIYLIDDFAHNPSEVAAAIRACQQICPTVMAYFQPHGFGPLRFMHKDLAIDVDVALRSSDVFLIGDVYYAGGTVNKDICPSIVSDAMTGNAVFVGNKENASAYIVENIQDNTVLLVMGARDPNLSEFGIETFNKI